MMGSTTLTVALRGASTAARRAALMRSLARLGLDSANLDTLATPAGDAVGSVSGVKHRHSDVDRAAGQQSRNAVDRAPVTGLKRLDRSHLIAVECLAALALAVHSLDFDRHCFPRLPT